MRCINFLETTLCNGINTKLIDYVMRFPFPYIDIIREQIAACQITNEWYSDCYKIHFKRLNNDVKQLPLWLPTVPQGCQVLKENGPLVCLLYIEAGYIVQIEVINMGMNEIDWEYLWSHKPVFDIEYDFSTICGYLTSEKLKIFNTHIDEDYVYLKVGTADKTHIICLWGCVILSPPLLQSLQYCSVDICVSKKDNHRYVVKFDDFPVLECALVCLHNTLIIN